MSAPPKKTRAEQLIDEFDSAAQAWGWSRDQGDADQEREDRQEHAEAKLKLIKHVKYLQAKAKRADHEIPEA